MIQASLYSHPSIVPFHTKSWLIGPVWPVKQQRRWWLVTSETRSWNAWLQIWHLDRCFWGGVSYGTRKTSMSSYSEKPTKKGTEDSSWGIIKIYIWSLFSVFGLEPLVSLDFPACQECLLLSIMSHCLMWVYVGEVIQGGPPGWPQDGAGHQKDKWLEGESFQPTNWPLGGKEEARYRALWSFWTVRLGKLPDL